MPRLRHRTLPDQIGQAAQLLEDQLTLDLLEATELSSAAEAALAAVINARAREGLVAVGSDAAASVDAVKAAAAQLQGAALGSDLSPPAPEVLLPLVVGLVRMGRLQSALQEVSKRSCDRMRNFIK